MSSMAAYTSSLPQFHHNNSLAIDGTAPWFQNLDSDSSSSWYPGDALLEFTETSKRKRLLFDNDDGFNNLCGYLCSENFSCRNQSTPIHGDSGNDDDDDRKKKKKKRVVTRAVYPFTFVKPGGIEGDVTLNDINKRLLMPPTRPVRHPVGDFGCRTQPFISAGGTSLSGKAVVALTKIYTQGRGSITVIRTKGSRQFSHDV